MNTPDTEKMVLELTRKYHPQDLGEPTSILENAIREALLSRDTYWKEMVEADRERIYDAIDDYFISTNPIPDAKILCGYIRETLKENLEVCEACGERHITSEDNLK